MCFKNIINICVFDMANIKMQLTYIFQQLKIVHIQIKMFPENIPAKNYIFTELKKNYFFILENEVYCEQ